ncbi:MAG: MFS transporter, partial [Armatimonadetes bacterium]|nr:MFS transporter [Armatimonadota bacterium]MDW8122597.1 MFS transporter [Armatimonadota bacterium]
MDSDGQSSSLRKRVAVAYFLLYGSIASLAGYLNLYLNRAGYSEGTIGTIGALMAVSGLVATPLWGWLSDRQGDRRLPLIVGAIGSALCLIGLLKAPYPFILVAAVAFSFFNSPLIAILDAFTLERLGNDKRDYGPLRAWGSAGFIALMLWFGLTLKGQSSPSSLVPALATFVALRIAMGVLCVSFPTNGKPRPEARVGRGDLTDWLTDRDWQVFLLISFLSMATNAAFFAFFPLYLSRAGVSDNWQGYFWVIAVVAETAFMAWVSGPLMTRMGLKGLLLLSVLGRAIRFALYTLSLPFGILALCQVLHSLTFGAAHTASVAWVSLRSRPESRAFSQSLFSGVLAGAAMAVGAQWGGWMIEQFGMNHLFAVASAVNLVTLFVGWRWLKEPLDR